MAISSAQAARNRLRECGSAGVLFHGHQYWGERARCYKNPKRPKIKFLKASEYNLFLSGIRPAIIYLGTNGLVRDVPVKRMREFEDTFLRELEIKMPDLLPEPL